MDVAVKVGGNPDLTPKPGHGSLTVPRKFAYLDPVATECVKRDRTAPLLRVEHLLSQHPHGLSAKELASRLGITIRTVYRDLHALEEELGFLPPMNLTLPEAVPPPVPREAHVLAALRAFRADLRLRELSGHTLTFEVVDAA